MRDYIYKVLVMMFLRRVHTPQNETDVQVCLCDQTSRQMTGKFWRQEGFSLGRLNYSTQQGIACTQQDALPYGLMEIQLRN